MNKINLSVTKKERVDQEWDGLLGGETSVSIW